MVDLAAAVAAHGHQAVEPLAFLVEGTREVGGDLLAAVVAQLHLHFTQWLGLGPLAAEVEHPAHAALAVQHRGGAAQKFHPLQRVRVGAAGVVGAVAAQQPVLVLAHVTAPCLEAVHAAVEVVGHGTRRVGRGLAQGLHALGFHLVAGDHADGLWGFQQGRVGLGGAQGALGHKAGDGAGGVLFSPVGIDRNGGQGLLCRRGRSIAGRLCVGCAAQGKQGGLCDGRAAQGGAWGHGVVFPKIKTRKGARCARGMCAGLRWPCRAPAVRGGVGTASTVQRQNE